MSGLMTVFVVLMLGYLLGRVTVGGLSLGSSGVLLVALVFGHYGYAIPVAVRDVGLVVFVAAVGFIAGPVFFRSFKAKALAFILLGFLVVIVGALMCAMCITVFEIPKALSIGMMTGALTSTPGLAAAAEATGDAAAAVGYGIAYPFGVVGVVLFVQLVNRFFKDPPSAPGDGKAQEAGSAQKAGLLCVDPVGIFPVAAASLLGLLIATVNIPLPGGARFNFGTAGGPLIAALVMGHFGRVGPLSLAVPKATLNTLREFGLVLFLAYTGTQAGAGFMETLGQYGVVLFFCGMLMTTLPMLVGLFFAKRIFGLSTITSLSCICGGMTSTPALGVLMQLADSDDAAAGYAATYPVALIVVVLSAQFLALLF